MTQTNISSSEATETKAQKIWHAENTNRQKGLIESTNVYYGFFLCTNNFPISCLRQLINMQLEIRPEHSRYIQNLEHSSQVRLERKDFYVEEETANP